MSDGPATEADLQVYRGIAERYHKDVDPDPARTLTKQIAHAMRLADAPLSEKQALTLYFYFQARSTPDADPT